MVGGVVGDSKVITGQVSLDLSFAEAIIVCSVAAGVEDFPPGVFSHYGR